MTRYVFDMGSPRAQLNISGLHFQFGIFSTEDEEEAQTMRDYIKAAKQTWQEVTYDPSDPRHNPALRRADNRHIVTGIHDSNAYKSNPLADSIINGTFHEVVKGQTDQMSQMLGAPIIPNETSIPAPASTKGIAVASKVA